MEALLFILSALAIIALLFMIKIVPQQQAWVLERLGKFDRVLQPGLNILIPIIERVAYKHTLKEQAMDVHAQTMPRQQTTWTRRRRSVDPQPQVGLII